MGAGNFSKKVKRNPKVTTISLVLVSILILAVVIVVVFRRSKVDNELPDNDLLDNYFANSVLRSAREHKLSLLSEITIFYIKAVNDEKKYEIKNRIKGIYDFKTGIEKQQLDNYENSKKTWTKDIYTIDQLSEAYEIDYKEKTCDSYDQQSAKTIVGFHLSHYMPKELIDLKLEHIMLSPNYLLYYMFSEYRGSTVDVKCERIKDSESNNNPVKCELINNQTSKVEYYFENVAAWTMYPKRIDVFQRSSANDEWNHYRAINYNKFEVRSDGKKLVNGNIPIGLKCDRKNKSKYQTLLPSFKNTDFFFDYDFSLTYNNSDEKKEVSRKYSGSMYCALSRFQTPPHLQIETFVHHGVNEETNKEMKTFYNRNVKTFYDYYPEDGQCKHRSESNSPNWFYWFDLFVKNPELFDFGYKPASYIGRYNVDGKESHVYERVLDGFDKLFNDEDESLLLGDGHSDNMNKISSNIMLAIYYYHAKEGFRSVAPMTMPFKMEFRLKETDGQTDVAKLVLDIKNYYPGILDYEKAFESCKNCIEKSRDYNQIRVKYSGDGLDNIKDIEQKTKQNFREKIHQFVSPLRTNELSVKTANDVDEDKDSIYVHFKLFDPLDEESHFTVTENEDTLCYKGTSPSTIFGINYRSCVIACLEDQDCPAFTYGEYRCFMCLVEESENFNDLLIRLGKKVNHSKYIKIVKRKGFKLGKKWAYFNYPKHSRNSDIVKEIKNRTDKSNLNLLFKNDNGQTYKFKAVDVKSKRVRIKKNE